MIVTSYSTKLHYKSDIVKDIGGRTETAVIKRAWVPTAAGASVRESAFAENTSVRFVMVRVKAPLCQGKYGERVVSCQEKDY
jgi:hypothetical protein